MAFRKSEQELRILFCIETGKEGLGHFPGQPVSPSLNKHLGFFFVLSGVNHDKLKFLCHSYKKNNPEAGGAFRKA